MGREVRMVPPNWDHPKYTEETARNRREVGNYIPLYNRTFAEVAREWKAEFSKWESGERPDYCSDKNKNTEYWEWAGAPPEREYYRPEWAEGAATWFQVYETVSEGTPVTPPFATKAELVDYLVANGDGWDRPVTRAAAEEFVNDGYVPSMVVAGGNIAVGVESSVL